MFSAENIKREYLLVAATVIILIICYQLAFKRTIEAWQINRQLKTQMTQSSDLSIQPGYIERKNTNLSRILDLYQADTLNFRNEAVSKISSIAEAENVKLAEVPNQDQTFHIAEFSIQRLSFEGDYSSLVKTIGDLQHAKGIGILRSAIIKKVKSHTTNDAAPKLVLQVYLEMTEAQK
jgi:hypothetical protein